MSTRYVPKQLKSVFTFVCLSFVCICTFVWSIFVVKLDITILKITVAIDVAAG